jgi:hypothetical protein
VFWGLQHDPDYKTSLAKFSTTFQESALQKVKTYNSRGSMCDPDGLRLQDGMVTFNHCGRKDESIGLYPYTATGAPNDAPNACIINDSKPDNQGLESSKNSPGRNG